MNVELKPAPVETGDLALDKAVEQIERTLRGELPAPAVKTFFDDPTFTATHVVHDPATKCAAIVDSVMDFDEPAGRTTFESADRLIEYVSGEGLTVEWLLETHAHADHLSAAPYIQGKLGGKIAIGVYIRSVLQVF